LLDALAVYRSQFQPSAQNARPHTMAGVNIVVADSDAVARRLFTSVQLLFTNVIRGTRGLMQPPIDDIERFWSPMEKAQVTSMLRFAIVGSPQTVRRGLEDFIARTNADELMVTANIFDQAARLRSYELLADIGKSLAG
jgi:alkanesulfonate monooxygenase SsuD/methylene tetrahydromethanopterin reductase-like flavin-dependent oxidoreductase (luciferase family)